MSKVNILGYGITNHAIVRLLNKNGIKCRIFDDIFTNANNKLDSENNELFSFQQAKNLEIQKDSLSIISPGIAPSSSFLKYFNNIIGEYDFIYNFLDNFYSIWISGTNGKTTTTEMLSLMLGAKSGGNIGIPLAELFAQDFANVKLNLNNLNKDENKVFNPNSFSDSKIKWVLETSSFALHYTKFALPNLYVLLPLSEDHISWHGNYEKYILDKLKPLVLINKSKEPKNHFAAIPEELNKFAKKYPKINDIIQNFKGNIFLYKDSKELINKFLLNDSKDLMNLFREPFKLDFILSASSMRFANIAFDIESIRDYKIGHYKMEEEQIGDILFVNDSKATNPHATLSALQAYKNYSMYLILGGDSKGAKVNMIYPLLKKHNVRVYTIGRDGGIIALECKSYDIEVKCVHKLKDAMKEIHNDILCDNDSKKKAVILSPACASLDQYPSYKHRGDEFNSLIKDIFNKQGSPTIKIYGIKNCNTMKKSFEYLDSKGINYEFIDFKKSGISKELLQEALHQIPLENLINKKGTTYKKLTTQGISEITLDTVMQNPSIIKRPLIIMTKEGRAVISTGLANLENLV